MLANPGRHQWIFPAGLRFFNWTVYGTFVAAFGLLGGALKRANIAGHQIQYPTRRIAVLPFDSSNPYLNGASLSDWFVVRILQKLPGVQVIERKDLMEKAAKKLVGRLEESSALAHISASEPTEEVPFLKEAKLSSEDFRR